MEGWILYLMVPGIIITVVVFMAARLGGKTDNNRRWNNLMVEMTEKYPTAQYTAQLEFLRRDKYAAIILTTNNHGDISELCEEYAMIMEEQQKMAAIDRQIGIEATPVLPGMMERRM
ncbi:MAG: hypothetical protein HUU02_03985 [Bacteroidetes bacterium]|nr:hypothetical protein [Bacteroidota bacterium]